jgi:signal peptidase II
MNPILVLTILALDQLTKFLAGKALALNQSVPVINGIFHITLIHNRGAAFGILKNQTTLFIFTSLLAIVLIYANIKSHKNRSSPIYGLSLSLILSGAVGNLIDRILYGYVVDFLDFRIWPVFNVSDTAITIGAILLGYAILKSKDGSNYASDNL